MNIGKKIKSLRTEKSLTQDDLAKAANTTKQTIHKYETGIIQNIPASKIKAIADRLGTTPQFLMGWENNSISDALTFADISPITTRKIPMLGNIATGEPIFAQEEKDIYIEVGTELKADYCLTVHGDSMIGARIYDGDIVFIKEQPQVENGEIAAVIIEDSVTLKRVYYYPNKGKLVLNPENPAYEPFIYEGEELNSIRILGKAVAFQSVIK